MARAKNKPVPFFEQRIAVIAIALLTAIVAGLAIWFAVRAMPDLPVREVTFQGATAKVSGESLASLAGGIRGSLFRTDLAEVKASIETVEWVRNADVRRRFPGALAVTLEEHVAAARWRDANSDTDADEPTLVNTYGEVFSAELSAESGDDLPLFVGAPAMAREVLIKYVELKTKLATIQRVPVEVKLSPRGAWSVKLDNEATLELGRSDADVRLSRFLAAYPQVAELQAPAVHVDLRYPAGLAMRKGTPTENNATKADKS